MVTFFATSDLEVWFCGVKTNVAGSHGDRKIVRGYRGNVAVFDVYVTHIATVEFTVHFFQVQKRGLMLSLPRHGNGNLKHQIQLVFEILDKSETGWGLIENKLCGDGRMGGDEIIFLVPCSCIYLMFYDTR